MFVLLIPVGHGLQRQQKQLFVHQIDQGLPHPSPDTTKMAEEKFAMNNFWFSDWIKIGEPPLNMCAFQQ